MRQQKGFTLVEMMVVLALVAFVLTFGMPAFGTWRQKHNATTQVKNFLDDLQLARSSAYNEKAPWIISWMGTNPTSYQMGRDANADGVPDPGTVKTISLKTAFSNVAGGVQSVTFDGRGFSNNAQTVVFRIPSSGGASNDCLTISTTRTKVGRWDGTNSICTPQ